MATRRKILPALAIAAACGITQAWAAEEAKPAPKAADPTERTYAPIIYRNSKTPSGSFNANMIFLADQIDRNSEPDIARLPVVVTTFAHLNDLSDASSFGRLVAEHLMHELKVRGWDVMDLRVTRDVAVNEKGEFSLSRDIKKLREVMQVGNVVAGTYLPTSDGILVSARVIDVVTGDVLSTAQTRVPKDKFALELIDKPTNTPTMKITR